MQTPDNGDGFHCYDPDRHRTVFCRSSIGTYEYDGNPSGSWVLTSATSPPIRSVFAGGGYDRLRRKVVYYDGGRTWEWDGSAWRIAAGFPPLWSFMGFAAHSGRGTVLAFGGPNEIISNDLYEWNGTTWNLLPTSGRPPRPASSPPLISLVYRTVAYDPRRDKFVVFGSAMLDWNLNVLSNFQPDLWEWDATNGWVQRFVQGGFIDLAAQLYFDSQRGVLTLVSGNPNLVRVAEWDGGNSWQPITPLHPAPSTADSLWPFGSYDEARGRFYLGLRLWNLGNNYRAYSYGTVSPARFEPLQPGCAGTLGEPALRLTHNWTRAWLGRSLSVDLTNLPRSTGIVALGWSDQQHGTAALPLSLASLGAPGCFARVAPDAVHFVAGNNQTATLSLPVPAHPALLGGVLFQQGWSFDPTANPLGLTTSNSVRLTIGSL